MSKNGIPTIVYLGIDAGICIATSEDDELVYWRKSKWNDRRLLVKVVLSSIGISRLSKISLNN
jgi:hypothetical protein